MNQINRLEEKWFPKWDLGLQEVFGFASESDATPDEPSEEGSSGWTLASKEVLNRQVSMDRRVATHGSSIADLIAYFENHYIQEGKGHE